MISRALVAILLTMNLGVAAWWLLHAPPSDQDNGDGALAGVPSLVLLAERPPPEARVPTPEPQDAVATEATVASEVSEAGAEPGAMAIGTAGVAADERATAETASGEAAATEAPLPGPADGAPPVAGADAGTDAATASEAPPPAVEDATLQCFSIGPFQSLDDLRRVSAAIEPALASQQVRETKGIEARGYKVYLPAFATRQEALETARSLEARGLRDYYVVTAGSAENTVSLGLFRELANAEARREEVRGYGLEPRLEPRNEEVTRWWLDISARADSNWRSRTGSFPGTRIEGMNCE